MTHATALQDAALLTYWQHEAPLDRLDEKIAALRASVPLLNIRQRSFSGPGPGRDGVESELDITLTLLGQLMAARDFRAAHAEGRSLIPPDRLQRLGIKTQTPGEPGRTRGDARYD